uniref:Uncharacterized protein n=1 Tax=Leptospirillum ferrodiazotrophum TaxID=412449 RepID=C6HTW6_9BACT|nr:MAG: hypothetical protein UBAL3_44810032 [Leptospirillum ferrodiazotrophum]
MTRFSYKNIAGLGAALSLLEISIPEENPIINSLAVSIRKSERWREKLEEENPDDESGFYADLSFEEECLTDDLIGVAFVVCQQGITSVVSNYCFLRKQWLEHQKTIHNREPKEDFLKISISSESCKEALMAKENPLLGKCSKIATINAFANYYKHRDEWPNDWDKKLPGKSLRTAEVILDAGAALDSPCSNCGKGYQKLTGEISSVRLDRLWKIIFDWSREIREKCRKDLVRCRCCPGK